jgi:hypothetical protein
VEGGGALGLWVAGCWAKLTAALTQDELWVESCARQRLVCALRRDKGARQRSSWQQPRHLVDSALQCIVGWCGVVERKRGGGV